MECSHLVSSCHWPIVLLDLPSSTADNSSSISADLPSWLCHSRRWEGFQSSSFRIPCTWWSMSTTLSDLHFLPVTLTSTRARATLGSLESLCSNTLNSSSWQLELEKQLPESAYLLKHLYHRGLKEVKPHTQVDSTLPVSCYLNYKHVTGVFTRFPNPAQLKEVYLSVIWENCTSSGLKLKSSSLFVSNLPTFISV